MRVAVKFKDACTGETEEIKGDGVTNKKTGVLLKQEKENNMEKTIIRR